MSEADKNTKQLYSPSKNITFTLLLIIFKHCGKSRFPLKKVYAHTMTTSVLKNYYLFLKQTIKKGQWLWLSW